MTLVRKSIMLLCCIASIACSTNGNSKHVTETGNQPDAPPVYVDNVNIVDVDNGRILTDRQMVLLNGRIHKINPANTPIAEQQFERIDAKGQFATPGLIDMHIHAYDPAAFAIALSHGVTHVRIMNGVKEHLEWQSELENGTLSGSTVTVSSPIISGFKGAPLHSLAATPQDARQAVAEAQETGYDLIKAYGYLKGDVLKALLDEAKSRGIPVAKHGPHPEGQSWEILKGLQSLEHAEDIFQGPLNYTQDANKLAEAIARIKETGVPVTPTLSIFWQLTQLSDKKESYVASLPQGYISPIIAMQAKHDQVKRWLGSSDKMVAHNKKTFAYLQHITKKLEEAEVPLLVGSDSGVLLSPFGISTLTEMRLMAEAGISPLTVLKAATINPSKALGKEHEFGQLKEGYRADFILSKQNPLGSLQTLETPTYVAKNGKVLSAQSLQQLRDKAINDRSLWQEMKTLIGNW